MQREESARPRLDCRKAGTRANSRGLRCRQGLPREVPGPAGLVRPGTCTTCAPWPHKHAGGLLCHSAWHNLVDGDTSGSCSTGRRHRRTCRRPPRRPHQLGQRVALGTQRPRQHRLPPAGPAKRLRAGTSSPNTGAANRKWPTAASCKAAPGRSGTLLAHSADTRGCWSGSGRRTREGSPTGSPMAAPQIRCSRGPPVART